MVSWACQDRIISEDPIGEMGRQQLAMCMLACNGQQLRAPSTGIFPSIRPLLCAKVKVEPENQCRLHMDASVTSPPAYHGVHGLCSWSVSPDGQDQRKGWMLNNTCNVGEQWIHQPPQPRFSKRLDEGKRKRSLPLGSWPADLQGRPNRMRAGVKSLRTQRAGTVHRPSPSGQVRQNLRCTMLVVAVVAQQILGGLSSRMQ